MNPTLASISLEYNVPSDETLYVFARGYEELCAAFDYDEQSQWFFQPNSQGAYTINVPVSSIDNYLGIGIAYGPPIDPGPGAHEEWDNMEEILFDECEEI